MTVQPRYLSPTDLAAYLGVSRNMVDTLVQKKVLPQPIYLSKRLPRWDRESVDAAIGRGAKSSDPIMDELDAAYPPEHSPAHS